jgi:histidine triad (HIT) family protein
MMEQKGEREPSADFYCAEVLSGRLPVEKVAETERVLAFVHTQPYWAVHIVVIPKCHIESLATMQPADVPIVQEMLIVAAELCDQVTAQYGGCRLSTNCGDLQSTKHLHFYVHAGQRLRDESGQPLT